MNRREKRRFFHNIKRANGLSKRQAQGAYGNRVKFLGDYKTLKVVPKSQRDTISCSIYGILDE